MEHISATCSLSWSDAIERIFVSLFLSFHIQQSNRHSPSPQNFEDSVRDPSINPSAPQDLGSSQLSASAEPFRSEAANDLHESKRYEKLSHSRSPSAERNGRVLRKLPFLAQDKLDALRENDYVDHR